MSPAKLKDTGNWTVIHTHLLPLAVDLRDQCVKENVATKAILLPIGLFANTRSGYSFPCLRTGKQKDNNM